jgi:hypothetical protein
MMATQLPNVPGMGDVTKGVEIADSIAECMEKAKVKLSVRQHLLLQAQLAVWVTAIKKEAVAEAHRTGDYPKSRQG